MAICTQCMLRCVTDGFVKTIAASCMHAIMVPESKSTIKDIEKKWMEMTITGIQGISEAGAGEANGIKYYEEL